MNNLYLHPLQLQELARNWLLEDTSGLHFEGFVVQEQETELEILMKSSGVLAGIPFIDAVYSQLGATVLWYNSDGDKIRPGSKIARVFGPATKLILAESIVLNVLSRASGIATITSKLCNIIKNVSWRGMFVSTNKTTPGFRMVEEHGLLVGGAKHRHDLVENMVTLKYNYIPVVGSIAEAVEKVRKTTGIPRKIKVECRTFQEALNAGKCGCDIVSLDIIESKELVKQAFNLKLKYPAMLIEVSGKITEDNLQDYVYPWIDIISSSHLVEGFPAIDFSMKVNPITVNLEE